MKTRFLTASHSLNNFGNSSVIHSTESFYNFSSFQDSHSVDSLQSYTGSHYSIPSTNLIYMTSFPKTYKIFPKTKFIYIEFAGINQDSQDTHFKLVSFKILQQIQQILSRFVWIYFDVMSLIQPFNSKMKNSM